MKCTRCSGLMVAERFYGGYSFSSIWSYHGFRCVNCGTILEDKTQPIREVCPYISRD